MKFRPTSLSLNFFAPLLLLLLTANQASAALVNPDGCPQDPVTDFETCHVDISSINGSVDYDWLGSYGKLTYTGTSGNISFRPDAINAAQFDALVDPFTAGALVVGADAYTFTLYFDASGNSVAGAGDASIDINGTAVADFSPFTIIQTLDGVALNGNLLTSDVTAAGVNSLAGAIEIDFIGDIDVADSLLSEYGDESYTFFSINTNNISYTNDTGNVWTSDWGATSVNVDSYVPLPASIWFLLSGLGGLLVFRKK